ncbi:MAG: cation-translocating P-type ATPase [Planctomycetales bacterium]|nr:cation-translocating P-type ATPase [Planctomycetales bacterium]
MEFSIGAGSEAPGATWSLRVAELDCAEEVGLIRGALEQRPGIVALRFDLLDQRVDVDVDEDGPSGDEVRTWIQQTGLTPTLIDGESDPADDEARRQQQRRATRALIIGGVANALAIAWSLWVHWRWPESVAGPEGLLAPLPILTWPAVLGHALAVLVCGWRLVPRAWAALRLGRTDMNVLMVIAVLGAMAIGEWSEAGLVTWLFALALRLEQWSLGRARDAIGRLLNLAPPQARVRQGDGSERLIPVNSIAVGQAIEVLPGDRVPLDGQVAHGASDVDLSSLTGESQPVSVASGDELLAGSLNLTGSITVTVTRRAQDSHLARVYRAMREAQNKRGQTERWVDRFAQWYTPTMALIALAVAVAPALLGFRSWSESIHSALVLLVTACPCALVISTPVTIMAALTAAARRGLVLRGGDVLERLAAIDSVVFDKTGTLTHGEFVVERVEAATGGTDDRVLAVAAGLERRSQHPLSRAVVEAWESRESSSPVAASLAEQASVRVVPGSGIESDTQPCRWIGNDRMRARHQAQGDASWRNLESEDLGSAVWVGEDDQLLGRIVFRDRTRDEAAEAIAGLGAAGIDRVTVLSGDRQDVVDRLAQELGISRARGGMLPEEKLAAVEKYRTEQLKVLMIGDGVNDAAALVGAHVGLAMGSGGTDLAKSAADGVLMHDRLTLVPWAIRHSRRSMRILIENLTAAILVKVVFFALAIGGYSSLWLAILADTGTSLAVIANALRAMDGRRAESPQGSGDGHESGLPRPS